MTESTPSSQFAGHLGSKVRWIPGLIIIFMTQWTLAEVRRPNILFCIADDASYPHMGAYGCTWVKTPGFDRVAKEGLLFTKCYTPNAKCSPSRACILTGRNSWQLEAACNHVPFFPAKFKTYVEALKEHGYHVGKTAKGWAPGIALDAHGKRRELTGTPYEQHQLTPPAKHISGNDYAANFEAFLKDNKENRSWCFWYGSLEPHRAYEYGVGVQKGDKKLSDIDHVPEFWPDTKAIRNDMLDYAYEIDYFDQHLVRMLDLLEKRGELDHTLVVVTADNGMPFPRVKGQKYEYSNHLPLAIRWPEGIAVSGRVIDDFVNFIDLAPTFIQLAGLEWEDTGMKPATGRSLFDIFRDNQAGASHPERDHVLIGKERHDIGRPNDWGYPVRGMVKGDYLYIKNYEPSRWPAGNPETGYLNCDGSPTKTAILNLWREQADPAYWEMAFGQRPAEELYDIKRDPECLDDLATKSAFREIKEGMREQMLEELKAQGDPRVLGNHAAFESYPFAEKERRHFYERFMKGERPGTGWVNPSDFERRF